MKIVSTGATLFSEQHYWKRKEERKKKLILWTTIAVLIIAGLIIIARLPKFLITEVGVEGARVITADEIERNVLETLSGKYFWLLPRANAAIYPRRKVRENLMKEFPRIISAELSLESSRILSINVVEREPFALHCPPLIRGGEEGLECFFLDKNGFIFDEAPAFSGTVYFIYSRTPEIIEPKGREFLPLEEFSPLAEFINGISKLGFEPVSADVGERDVAVSMQNESRILFDRTTDLTSIFSDLEVFLENPSVERSKLKEIDLRVENKIFWKIFGNN